MYVYSCVLIKRFICAQRSSGRFYELQLCGAGRASAPRLDTHLMQQPRSAPQIEMMNSNKAVFNHILISERLITMLLSEDTVSQLIHRLNSLSLHAALQHNAKITITNYTHFQVHNYTARTPVETLLQRLLSVIELTAAQKHSPV